MTTRVLSGGFLLVENLKKDDGGTGKSMCLPWKFFCGIIELVVL